MQKIPALNNIRMDKTAFSVSSLDDESDERQYWLSKTPVERLYSVEIMRQRWRDAWAKSVLKK